MLVELQLQEGSISLQFWKSALRVSSLSSLPAAQLGEVMLSMASNMMLADERVLWMAQRDAMACSRIVSCLQKIAGYRLAAAQAFSLVSP